MTGQQTHGPYHPELVGLLSLFAPKERPLVAAWAEANFKLSAEYSASTNLIELDRFQVEMLNAFSDEHTKQITVMSATQLVKTLLMQICIAWAMVHMPGPMLFIGATDEDVKKFSIERFTTMCRDNKMLGDIIAPAKSRDSANRIDHKMFRRGGSIDFVGSVSPGNVARRTTMLVCCDEVDKWVKEGKEAKEGDRIALARARMARYGSRAKMLIACSPTIRGASRIEQEFQESDQRHPYVECWDCHHPQVLRWHNVKFESHLSPREAGLSARYICEKCKTPWTEQQRRWTCANTLVWKPHAQFYGNAGFWVSHLYSGLQVHSLAEIVEDFMKAKDHPGRVEVFKNTRMAELFEVEGDRPEHQAISERAEPYEIRGADIELPDGIEGLIAGADCQARRVETQVLGFGKINNEFHLWVVDYHVTELFEEGGIPKVTSADAYWKEQRRILDRTYRTKSGVRLPILAMCIDSAHQGESVYQFAASCPRPNHGPKGIFINHPRTVVCTRGFDSDLYSPIHGVSDRETARMRSGSGKDIPIVTLGTGYLKTLLYGALQSPESSFRIHFSHELLPDYYKGLASERRVVEANRILFQKVYPRNEPLDTFVYALGAFYLIRADRWTPDEWDAYRTKFGLAKPKDGMVRKGGFQSSYLME